MKLIVLIILTAAFTVSASNSYSQIATISLKAKGQRVGDILTEIENQSDFFFLYNNRMVDVERRVSIDVENRRIEPILNTLFSGTDVKYQIKDRQVMLLDSKRSSIQRQQPESRVVGVVFDDSNMAMVGVTCSLVGTNRGTITDIDGKFTIQDIKEGDLLRFSFIGYKSVDIIVGDDRDIEIKMVVDAIGLEEVVAIGYGVQKKVNLTGAVASISADEMTNRPTTNVSSALQGLTPGVVVTSNTGEPGATSSIKIRGNTSVNGNPLLVLIDGVEGDMNSLNTDDIENMSILKDAASAAIYGSRAAGGVILITTKSSNSTKLSVSYNNNFSLRTPTRMPQTNSGYDHATLWNSAYETKGTIGYSEAHIDAILDPNVSVIPVEEGSSVSFSSLDGWLHASSVDWTGMMFDQSSAQNHNLSISKSGDVDYRLSIGYTYDGGFFSEWGTDAYTRLNTRLSIGTDLIKDRVNLDVKLAYANENTEGNYVDIRNIYRTPATMPVKDTNGNFLRYRMQGNAIQELEEAGETSNILNRFEANGKLTIDIVDGLTLTSLNGVRFNTTQVHNFKNPVAKWTSDGSMRAELDPLQYTVTRNNYQYNYVSTQNYLQYEKIFADLHSLTVMLGQSAESGETDNLYTYRPEVVGSNVLPSLNLGSADDATNSNTLSEWALTSFYGRLNYSYDNKYLFEATFRLDSSSKFSEANRTGFFPSFSAGWRLSEESFLKDSEIFQNLKLRGSWGQLGNQSGLGNYDHIPVYSFGSPVPFGDSQEQWAVQSELSSEDRTWETVEAINVGLDIGVLDGRLNLTAEYFQKRNIDMLISSATPKVIGISVPTGNYGELKVDGWELNMSWSDKVGDFNYGVNFNISDQKDELVNYNVTDISKGVGTYVQGYAMNSVFGYRTDGYFTSEDEVTNHPFINSNTGVGDIKYLNQDGDDMISAPNDVVYLGETSPHYVMGLGVNATYKQFDLNLFFQGVGKKMTSINQEWGDPSLINPTNNSWDNYSFTYQNDYWTPENLDARFPRATVGQSYNYWVSDHWLENGAYVRLKNLQLGYSLPQHLLEAWYITKLRVYFSGENLCEYTKLLDGFDPEVGNGTSGSTIYPLKRAYSFGLNLSF